MMGFYKKTGKSLEKEEIFTWNGIGKLSHVFGKIRIIIEKKGFCNFL